MNRKSKTLLTALAVWALLPSYVWAQDAASGDKDSGKIWKTQCGTPTGQRPFPTDSYRELPQHKAADPQEWQDVKGTAVSWGSTDIRYAKTSVPQDREIKKLSLKGWRGEKVSAQALVWTSEGIDNLNYEISDLKGSSGSCINADSFESGFVRYVMTDEANPEGQSNCGARPDHTIYDSTMVADCIDHLLKATELEPMQTQPIWLSCRIPADARPGRYKGKVEIRDGSSVIGSIALELTVDSHVLPAPDEWAFHLDLWQNPFAVARYYGTPLWSEEHFESMRPIMQRLADAGQKVITTSITHKPWNGQTEDYFESMVTWIKKLDGTWEYRFDVFDRWVEFMMGLGIDGQINCYSMVPWKLSFQYFDQGSNRMQFINAAPGDKEYEELWTGMLKAFASHLREKGWFDICTIAMDERPMEVMQKTIAVIYKADPQFKISLAGHYHPEIEKDIYDYCITINESFPEEVVELRRKEGKRSTLYTCCSERYPNTFTYSPLSEAAWIGCYMAAQDVDGYLRWAYNSWPLEPLLDSRFRTWSGGDTYLVYPGNRSSARFEKMIEGIQIYEKIRILKQEYAESGNEKGLREIEEALGMFRLDTLPETPASTAVENICKIF